MNKDGVIVEIAADGVSIALQLGDARYFMGPKDAREIAEALQRLAIGLPEEYPC